MARCFRLDARPDGLEAGPEFWAGCAQSQVDDARMGLAVSEYDPADVAVEGDDDAARPAAAFNDVGIGRTRRDCSDFLDVVTLLTQPVDDRPVQILVSQDAHRQAAESGTSTTSSVARASAA